MSQDLHTPVLATDESLQQSFHPLNSSRQSGDTDPAAPPKQPRKTASTADFAAFDFDSSPAPHQPTSTLPIDDSSLQPATAVAFAANPDQLLSSRTTTVATTDTPQQPSDIPSMSSEVSLASPPLKLTLLCMTGARVALTVDQKFISAHSLPVKEPDSITVSQFKHVIYNEWMSSQKKAEGDRQEVANTEPDNSSHTANWGTVLASGVTPVPASPDHIRLIHLGKVLVDEYTLEEYKISSSNSFNVLHLSIRPESMGSKDKNGSGKQGRTKRRVSATGGGRLSATHSRRGDGTTIADTSDSRNAQSRSGCCIIS